jgi:hypothetical protein
MSSLYNPYLPQMGETGQAAPRNDNVFKAIMAVVALGILASIIAVIVLQLKSAAPTPSAPAPAPAPAPQAARMAMEQHAMRMAAAEDATRRQQQLQLQHQQLKHQQQQQHMAKQAMYRAMREAEELNRRRAAAAPRVRYELGARPLAAKPEDAFELPSMQLSTPEQLENTVDSDGLGFITASTGGTLPGAMMGTGASSTSATAFEDSAYEQDSTRMTPDAASEGTGIDAFMPKTDAVDASGRDPQTNLPVFTTSKLKRSNVLGGHGAQSFLRPVQDPLAGYKRLGKVMRTTSDPRDLISGLDKRRAQYNKARVESGTEDPVLFMGSDWQMF